jgi:DNA polymerase-1
MNTIIQTKEDLIELARKIKNATEPIAVDTETNGLTPTNDTIIGIAIAFSDEEGYYVPTKHRNSPNIPERLVLQLLNLLSEKKLIWHNAKFDIQMVYTNYKVKLPVFADTMAMAYIACFPKLALKEIMKEFFQKETKEFDELLKEYHGAQWKRQGYTVADLLAENIVEYAVNDTLYTYKLFNTLKDEMKDYGSIMKLELNLIPLISQMNLEGYTIDTEKLNLLSERAKVDIMQKVKEMRAVAGERFEPNSSRQVGEVLFNQLGMPVTKRSQKTGAPSADKDILEELSYLHPFPKTLKEYRSLSKFISGYLDKIPNIVERTGKLYANYTALGAESGRFTCPGMDDHTNQDTAVNLQNQPKSEDFDVRSAFIAPEGWTFVKADYSQIEYRMMNNIAGETAAIEKFNQGMDFHTATARLMLGIPDDQELTKEQRALGKVLNFGISYGMAVPTVAKMIGKTDAEAQQLYDAYFAALPKLAAFIAWAAAQVKEHKAVKTIFGRVRKLDYTTLPPRMQADYIKKGFNTIVQGSAADILKIAMLRVQTMVLEKHGRDKVRLMGTVHDELDYYVKTEHLEEVLADIRTAMRIVTPDNWCNFEVDISYGRSWSESEHIEYKPIIANDVDVFQGWGAVLPKEYITYLDEPDYSAVWPGGAYAV